MSTVTSSNPLSSPSTDTAPPMTDAATLKTSKPPPTIDTAPLNTTKLPPTIDTASPMTNAAPLQTTKPPRTTDTAPATAPPLTSKTPPPATSAPPPSDTENPPSAEPKTFPPHFAPLEDKKTIRRRKREEKRKQKELKKKAKSVKKKTKKVQPIKRPHRTKDDYILYELPNTDQTLVQVYEKYIGYKKTSLKKEKKLTIKAAQSLARSNRYRIVPERSKYVPLEPLSSRAVSLERGVASPLRPCTCPFSPCVCARGIVEGSRAIPAERRLVCWKSLRARLQQLLHPSLPSPAFNFLTRLVAGVTTKVYYYKRMNAFALRGVDPLFCLAEQFPYFICNRFPDYEYREMMRVLNEMQARQIGEWQEEVPEPVCYNSKGKDFCSVWTQTHMDSDGEPVVGRGRHLWPRGARGALPPLCHLGGAKLRLRQTSPFRKCSPTLLRKAVTKAHCHASRLANYLMNHLGDASGLMFDLIRDGRIPDRQCIEDCLKSRVTYPPAPRAAAPEPPLPQTPDTKCFVDCCS